jgi:hypothetical protein
LKRFGFWAERISKDAFCFDNWTLMGLFAPVFWQNPHVKPARSMGLVVAAPTTV